MPDRTIPARGKIVFFSDLDGTLLDHETYSFKAAREALGRLRALEIPLVLASSKTAAEIAPLREELGFADCPAIVENGAGVLPAGRQPAELNGNYQVLIDKIKDIPVPYREFFRGFSSWSIDEIAARTGLSPDAAARAKARQFSEPGLWSGSDGDLAVFQKNLAMEGISAQVGGRFITLSFGGNKAGQMAQILSDISKAGTPAFSVALGDAPNDIAMLEAADRGIIIPNPGHGTLPVLAGEASGRIIRAKFPGPRGWNEAVLQVLCAGGTSKENDLG